MKVLISGCYGTGNVGDELILEMARQAFTEHEITVVSKNPNYTSKKFDLKAVQEPQPYEFKRTLKNVLKGKLSLLLNQVKFKQTLSSNDVFVLGGGGLLVDISDSVIDLYLSQLRLAKKSKCKVMTYCIGAGPIHKNYNQKKLAKVFNECVDFISVRDDHTRDLLVKCGVTRDIHVFPDPVEAFRIDPEPVHQTGKVIINMYRLRNDAAIFTGNSDEANSLEQAYLDFINYLDSEGYEVVLLPFGAKYELEYNQSLLKKLPKSSNVVCKNYGGDFKAIVNELASAEYALTMRFHGSLLSVVLGVPSICVDAQYKAQRLLEAAGLKELLLVIPDQYQTHGKHGVDLMKLKEKFFYIKKNKESLMFKFMDYKKIRKEEYKKSLGKIYDFLLN